MVSWFDALPVTLRSHLILGMQFYLIDFSFLRMMAATLAIERIACT